MMVFYPNASVAAVEQANPKYNKDLYFTLCRGAPIFLFAFLSNFLYDQGFSMRLKN